MDYSGKCQHPHGHNGRVEIELCASELDGRGMVMDFEQIQQVIQQWIDEQLDHKMILRRDDPLVSVLAELGEPCFVMDTNPTAECIAKLIYDYAAERGFPILAVRLWETDSSFATYHCKPSKEEPEPGMLCG